MSTPLSVLLVEDSASDAALVVRQLKRDGFEVAHKRVEDAGQMRAALGERAWDIVLSDFNVPGFGAIPALALLRELKLDIPFIVVSGVIGEEAAVALMKAGAHDCVMKDHLALLAPAVRREVGEAQGRLARARAEQELRESEARFRGLIEQSLTGIYISQDGVFRYANPRLEQMLGYSPGQLVGVLIDAIVPAEDLPILLQEREKLRTGAGSISYEVRARRVDGEVITLGLQGSVYEFNGKPATVGMAQDISEKIRAEEQIERYIEQLKTAFRSTVEVATSLSELRDPYTAGHERRVAEIAVALGTELGFDEHRLEGLRVAGHLHDVGKITIPAEILSKPGKLSPIEFKLIQAHADAGYEVLRRVEFPWPVAEVALQHHERMDGSGYPHGLIGEAIRFEARVIAVADVIEAMSSHRPYRPGLGITAALAEIERGRGRLYDARVADVCLRLFHEKGYTVPE